MNKFIFVLLLFSSKLFADVKINELILTSSKIPSQIRPNDIVTFKAKIKSNEQFLYHFEEEVDGVSLTIQDYSSNSAINYHVPETFKVIKIKVSAKEIGHSEEVSTQKLFTYNGQPVISKETFYKGSKGIISHPGIVVGKNYEVKLISGNNEKYSLINGVLSEGELLFKVPIGLDFSSGNDFVLTVSGINVPNRIKTTIINSGGLEVLNHVLKKGMPLSFKILEDVDISPSEYPAILDNDENLSLFSNSPGSNVLTLDTSSIAPGLHNLKFSINSLNFEVSFFLNPSDVISNPVIFLNTFIEDSKTSISNLNISDFDKNKMLQFINKFEEVLDLLNPDELSELASFTSQIKDSYLGFEKSKSRVPYEAQLLAALGVGAGGLYLAVTGTNNLLGYIFVPVQKNYAKGLASAALQMYAGYKLMEQASIKFKEVRKKRKASDDSLDIRNNNIVSETPITIQYIADYENLNKNDKNHEGFIIRTLYENALEIKNWFLRIKALPQEPFEFDVYDVEVISPVTSSGITALTLLYSEPKNFKVDGLPTNKIKVISYNQNLLSNTATLNIVSEYAESKNFTFEVDYSFPGVISKHTSKISATIFPKPLVSCFDGLPSIDINSSSPIILEPDPSCSSTDLISKYDWTISPNGVIDDVSMVWTSTLNEPSSINYTWSNVGSWRISLNVTDKYTGKVVGVSKDIMRGIKVYPRSKTDFGLQYNFEIHDVDQGTHWGSRFGGGTVGFDIDGAYFLLSSGNLNVLAWTMGFAHASLHCDPGKLAYGNKYIITDDPSSEPVGTYGRRAAMITDMFGNEVCRNIPVKR